MCRCTPGPIGSSSTTTTLGALGSTRVPWSPFERTSPPWRARKKASTTSTARCRRPRSRLCRAPTCLRRAPPAHPAEAQWVAGTATSMRFEGGAFRLRYVASGALATEVYVNEPLRLRGWGPWAQADALRQGHRAPRAERLHDAGEEPGQGRRWDVRAWDARSTRLQARCVHRRPAIERCRGGHGAGAQHRSS